MKRAFEPFGVFPLSEGEVYLRQREGRAIIWREIKSVWEEASKKEETKSRRP